MITFDSGGGLGNQIFQYVAARLLAEHLGYYLETRCPPTVVNVLNPTEPKEGNKHLNDRIHIIEQINSGNILDRPFCNRHIHLQGYWQDHFLYSSNRDKILGYFNEKADDYPDEENIVMHVRLGDYKIFGPNGNVLDPNYYHHCLEHEKFKRLFIVTDQPNDEYFVNFLPYNPIFTRGGLKEDFWFIAGFSRIIIANSTFSWWSAFLSNAEKIYTPKCWIRNSTDIVHELQNINNGKCEGIQMDAGFKDYN